jgi:hypothetical protein
LKKIYTLVATAKNEGPYLWEWVAYHRSIGFDNIIIFQNDSDDLTSEILTCLQEIGVVKYLYNHAKQGAHQVSAYKRSARQAEYQSADWIMALDLDEFLVVKTGDGTLDALFRALPPCHRIFVNWRLFGSAGISELDEGLVTDRFTVAEWEDWIIKHVRPYKSLYKRVAFQRPGVHKPHNYLLEDELITINGSGLTSDKFETRNFQCDDPDARSLVQVNHYIVKDAQSFAMKAAKGSAHQSNRAIDKDYWNMRNKNQQFDDLILKHRARLVAQMDKLDAQSEGRLSTLTQSSVEHHKNKFIQMSRRQEFRDLFEHCQSNNALPARIALSREGSLWVGGEIVS